MLVAIVTMKGSRVALRALPRAARRGARQGAAASFGALVLFARAALATR